MTPVIRRAGVNVTAFAIGVFAFTGCAMSDLGVPTIRFVEDSTSPDYGRVDVFRVQAYNLSMRDSFTVRIGDSKGPPMTGTYGVSRAGDTLQFYPRFRPVKGVTYVAKYLSFTKEWRVPADSGPGTTVVATIHPEVDVVPMNLQRMYVEFSVPMTTGNAYQHIRLYEGDSLVAEPFTTAGDVVELWDPDRRRLTLLFDPGRFKRDLAPNEQVARPLREGKSYRLAIDTTWKDAAGRALALPFEKTFRVAAIERSLVSTRDWKVSSVGMGRRDSLIIDFPKPLDRALLDRMLSVSYGAGGGAMSGQTSVLNGGRRWVFVPRGTWNGSSVRLDVLSKLEDLAGNSIERQFDVMPGDASPTGTNNAWVRVPVTVTPNLDPEPELKCATGRQRTLYGPARRCVDRSLFGMVPFDAKYVPRR